MRHTTRTARTEQAAASIRVLLAITLGSLAGCGSAGPVGPGVASLHHGAQATPGSAVSDLQKYQAVVVCARLHGLPNLPDASVDDHGQPQFPALPGGGKPPQTVLDGCKILIDRLPQRTATGRPALSAAQLAQARQFSACVRTHGYPAFPDPSADGTFNAPSTSSLPAKESPAFQACRHLLPTTGR